LGRFFSSPSGGSFILALLGYLMGGYTLFTQEWFQKLGLATGGAHLNLLFQVPDALLQELLLGVGGFIKRIIHCRKA